ncbi:MAG TPA: DNA polymerase III subunit gamma/tau [Saprospiraceae bacterium]|nr:DNA polymerase III subunit gamma/tau [Saprospiraceae bacterium]
MSTFVVSARKYRPHRFEDVVGQSHVTNTLKNALRNDHLAHAFLFCGPRGVGKTTCARILAKVLNCKNIGEDFEPCNECSSCQSFNENASFNITELDAASNNSVEHIRALIEQVRFQPQQGKYKVFIIDEVHMLSQQAFNAFLKTLEEPPPYAIFILATTEKHKIIPTILSRCQIFDFKRIQIPDMVAHLRSICDTENIQADAEALHIVAQKADGALRDALSIFDRIAAFSGKEIVYQDVIDNLNVLDYDYYFKFVDALLIEDMSSVMLTFDEVLKKGFDPDIFLNGLAEHLRNLLVAKDQQTIDLLTLSEALQKRYLEQAAKTSSTFLLTALNLANDCDIHYKTARNKRLHVEMALIKMTYIQRAVDISEGSASLPEKKRPEQRSPASKDRVEAPLSSSKTTKTEASGQEAKSENAAAAAPTKEPDKPSEEESSKPESDLAEASSMEAAADEATDEIEEEVIEEAAEQELVAATNGTSKEAHTASVMAMPKLGNMDKMLQQLREEEAKEVVPTAKYDLSQENLDKIWEEYVAKVEQDSVRNLLQNVRLTLEGKAITALVGSKLGEGAIRQQSDIIHQIREDFGDADLSFSIVIDKRLKPKEVKKTGPLNDKEKLRAMYEKNPEIKTLAKKFGLRFDE